MVGGNDGGEVETVGAPTTVGALTDVAGVSVVHVEAVGHDVGDADVVCGVGVTPVLVGDCVGEAVDMDGEDVGW